MEIDELGDVEGPIVIGFQRLHLLVRERDVGVFGQVAQRPERHRDLLTVDCASAVPEDFECNSLTQWHLI